MICPSANQLIARSTLLTHGNVNPVLLTVVNQVNEVRWLLLSINDNSTHTPAAMKGVVHLDLVESISMAVLDKETIPIGRDDRVNMQLIPLFMEAE